MKLSASCGLTGARLERTARKFGVTGATSSATCETGVETCGICAAIDVMRDMIKRRNTSRDQRG